MIAQMFETTLDLQYQLKVELRKTEIINYSNWIPTDKQPSVIAPLDTYLIDRKIPLYMCYTCLVWNILYLIVLYFTCFKMYIVVFLFTVVNVLLYTEHNCITTVSCRCFLQVGQHLGSLEYLLPAEYVDTMKVLHSKAPESPLQEIYQVIEEELKCKVSFTQLL